MYCIEKVHLDSHREAVNIVIVINNNNKCLLIILLHDHEP